MAKSSKFDFGVDDDGEDEAANDDFNLSKGEDD